MGRSAYMGGKPDDITVLVSLVTSAEEWKNLREKNQNYQTTASAEPLPKKTKGDSGDGSVSVFVGKAWRFMQAKL